MLKIRNEFQLGLFVLIGLVLFLGSLFAIGSEQQIFGSKDPFVTYFTDIKGLNSGAVVRLGGITIGKVGEVEFKPRSNNKNIKVNLKIDREYTSHLKTDTTASLGTQGLLGDKFINISIGVDTTNLKVGSEITSLESVDISEVTDTATGLVKDVSSTVTEIKAVVDEIKNKGLKDLIASINNLNEILVATKSGEGVIAALINSKELSNDLKQVISNFKQISSTLNKGPGLLPQLLNDPRGGEILEEIKTSSSSIKEIATSIHNIIPSDQSEESIVKLLKQIAKNLDSVSESLAKGEGTLGALIMDSSLYDNAVDITSKAKRNFILREAIRQSLD